MNQKHNGLHIALASIETAVQPAGERFLVPERTKILASAIHTAGEK